MTFKDNLDNVLSSGIQRGDAAGVSAVVGNREGIIYEGAFGERSLGSGVAMTPDTVG